LECLRKQLPTWKRKTLEQRVRAGCVRVNGAVIVRPETPVAAGDAIELADRPFPVATSKNASSPTASNSTARPNARLPFAILHDDAALIAIDKPADLLAVGTDAGGERNALALLRAHIDAPLWPVHRIDRETSGVLLFARSLDARDRVQSDWPRARKTYLAIVEGRIEPANGAIDAPLWEDAQLFVHVGAHPNAKSARTEYRTVRATRKRTLLEVELDTGRRHQIRAHLASRGCPVVGDPRYGVVERSRGAPKAARMGLHARRLVVAHPLTGAELALEARAPRAFDALLD
ncbi:MAG: RluA family pseudouridine synthase, partial [Planctomycetota bacterium]